MGKPTPIGAAAPANVTPFNFGDHAVRVAQDDHGEPWFVVADVAEALGYSSVKDAQRSLTPDEKGSHIVLTLGGQQRMTTVNEAGLYALIMRSRKPAARAFSRWVRGEVLPSLRKTGQYIANSKQKPHIAGIESAQPAIKQIAYDPASAIGKDLPPLPAGYEFPPEIMAQIEAAVIPQAMACIPALRSYMMRRVKHLCTNAHGLDAQRVPQAIATASLASALNHTAHEQYHHICTLITSLHTVTGYAAEKVKQAARGQGACLEKLG